MARDRAPATPLIVVSGPSGVGKSTIVARLVERHPDYVVSVSATTRAPRPGEVEGREYRFVTREVFARMRDAGDLLEWAEVHGEWYGTPRASVEEARAAGSTVILEIDVQGAREVKRAAPDALTVFVEPPDWETLERRLEERATEGPEQQARRRWTALKEVAAAQEFDVLLTNDRLEDAVRALEALVERTRKGS